MKKISNLKKIIFAVIAFCVITILIGVIIELKTNNINKNNKSSNDKYEHSIKSYEEASQMAQNLYANEERNVKVEEDSDKTKYIIYVSQKENDQLIYKFYLHKDSGYIEQIFDGVGLNKKAKQRTD